MSTALLTDVSTVLAEGVIARRSGCLEDSVGHLRGDRASR